MKNNLFRASALLFLLLVFLLSIISVSALGVTPGRKIVDFTQNENKELSFRVINSEDRAMNLRIVIKGDLNSSFSINQNLILIQPKEEKDINYKITLPGELGPGNHVQEIMLVEVPDSEKGGSIGAIVGVITQVYVKVPYPGKYAEVEFNIESAEIEQEVSFFIPITNLGQENLDAVSAEIEVFNSNGEKVAVVLTDKSPIKTGERKEIVGKWRADVTPGVYSAKAVVNYDGKIVNLEKQFNIGQKILELVGVNVRSFSLGEIAKFEMLVQNKWGEELKNVYSQTNVYNNQETIADFKSPTYDIPPLSNNTFFSYWDTEGIDKGLYDASVYLRYGEKFSKKNVQFKVSDNSIETIGLGYAIYGGNSSSKGSTTNMLIVIIIVLVILNLLWFVIFRRKMNEKSLKNKGK